jgi:GNAT superfamily N-acetyltransferase
VARELAEFLLRFDGAHDGLWLAVVDGRVEGAIAIDGARAEGQGAHLRWFIVSERLRGRGAGRALLAQALGFCRSRGFASCHLWTFAGLDAAAHLYREQGFKMSAQQRAAQWGVEVDEQRYELHFEPGRA